jgi:hypothetical protein
LRAAFKVRFVPVISVVDSEPLFPPGRRSVQSPIWFQRVASGLGDRPICRIPTLVRAQRTPSSRPAGSQKTFSAKPGSFSG